MQTIGEEGYSRREFGALVLAGLPLSMAMQRIDSRIRSVQIGAITYSFRTLAGLDDIIKAMVTIGLGEVELMANHAEVTIGAPAEGRSAEEADALRAWRQSAPIARYAEVRKKFTDAGIDLRLLCFNMSRDTTDDEIEYGFQTARVLGVRAITSSTQVSVAKRVAPFADKHRMTVGYHGHSNVRNPDEFATPESFATAMSYSKYHGINLDIGHFTAANFDAVPFIKAHHDRITNLHLKDRKRDQGPNVPWGQGDTPIKEVLQLLDRERYGFPANIEFEYPGADPVAEVAKCLQFCREALG